MEATAGVASKERRILVAVDEGEESRHALSWCLQNMISSNPKGTRVLLLHVKPPRAVYPAMDGTGDIMAAMDKYENDVAQSVIERAKSMCQDVKVETRVEHGDPRDVICQTVEKQKADMLVMGSHGYGLFKRALLGSVSSHCAQNAKCPVLIVKRPN